MWKAVLAGTTALVIVGSSLVYAQQRGRPGGFERWQPNIEDMRAFANARLAALHGGLGIDPRPGEELAGLRAGFARDGEAAPRPRGRGPQIATATDSRSPTIRPIACIGGQPP